MYFFASLLLHFFGKIVPFSVYPRRILKNKKSRKALKQGILAYFRDFVKYAEDGI